MTETRRYDADASRAAILAAAEALFLEQGFAATSVSAIARSAGVTKSLIHHHFGSKEALWEAIKHGLFAEFHEQQMEMLRHQEADEDLLERSFLLYFRFLRARPALMRLKAWMELSPASGDAKCESLDFELMALGVQRIAEGQSRGLIRDDMPASYILLCFLGMVETWFQNQGMIRGALVAGGDLGPDEPLESRDEAFIEHAIRMFFDGVRPRG